MMLVTIANFSGGKDSTAMVLLEKENIDYVLFVDTGVEYPEIIENVKKVQKVFGNRFVWLNDGKDFYYYTTKYVGKKNGKPYSFPSFRNRWCTGKLKVQKIKEFYDKFKNQKIVTLIGIAYDERKRIKKSSKTLENEIVRYPLIERKMTEKDCLEYCYSHGYDFGGIYDYINRASCYICPFAKKKEIYYIITKHPEIWKKIKDTEKRLREAGVRNWKFHGKGTNVIEEGIFCLGKRSKNFIMKGSFK